RTSAGCASGPYGRAPEADRGRPPAAHHVPRKTTKGDPGPTHTRPRRRRAAERKCSSMTLELIGTQHDNPGDTPWHVYRPERHSGGTMRVLCRGREPKPDSVDATGSVYVIAGLDADAQFVRGRIETGVYALADGMSDRFPYWRGPDYAAYWDPA